MVKRERSWRAWLEDAVERGDGGDLAFLADEAPNQDSGAEALRAAAGVLAGSNSHALAERCLQRLRALDPEANAVPIPSRSGEHSKAFIFSGHRVDAPDRPKPRFPAGNVDDVARAIQYVVEEQAGSSECVAVCSGAAGGDLLFLEAVRVVGMQATVCLPYAEPEFLESSVSDAGAEWEERYFRLTRSPGVDLRVLPLDPPPYADPYERCNRWMVYRTLASGANELRGLVVWNGRTGDGAGGAEHMASELKAWQVSVTAIDPLSGVLKNA